MGRYRIGIIIHSFEGLYHELLFRGFCVEAEEQGVDLLFFPGTELDKGRNKFYRSAGTVYNLPSLQNVDGLIAVATSLFSHSENEDRNRLLARFADIPMVSLGDPLKRCPSVAIDAGPGIREAVHHLVEDHGYRRLGLIAGPEGGWESTNRTRVFLEELEKHGLTLSAEYRTGGSFTEDSGARAIQRFYEQGKLDMQAIFVENDEMAVGAVRALQELNLNVPEDIAIIGFDGIPHLESMTPPVTTVHQPIQQQAKESLRMMIRLIEGGTPQDLTLGSRLIIRESCGCRGESRIPMVGLDHGHQQDEERQIYSEWLVDTGNERTLINDIGKYIESQNESEPLLDLRRYFSAVYSDDILNDRVKTFGGPVRDMVNRRILAIEGRKLWDMLNLKWRDWAVSRDGMIRSSDMPGLAEELETTCNLMNIRYLRLVIYPNPTAMDHAYLAYSYPEPAGDTVMEIDDIAEVLPPADESSTVFQVCPVYHQDEVYGYLIIRMGNHYVTYYEDLRLGISGALNTIKLLKELKDTHERLSNARRLATVGTLVKGIAHEISGPVGTALTAISHINDLLESEKYGEISDAARVVVDSLVKATKIITSLKELQTEQRQFPESGFRVKEWVNAAFLSLPEPLPAHCHYRIEGYEGLVKGADPHDVIKIIMELAGNSLSFCYPDDRDLNMIVRITAERHGISLIYIDDGPGVGESIAGRIFEPFFTTERSSGHKGLGLPVVYSTVVTLYNGSIEILQPEEGGVAFEMFLPWPVVSESND